VVEHDLHERVSADEPRLIEQRHDHPPMWTNAVPPKQLAFLRAARHVLQRRSGSVNEGYPRIATETARIRALAQADGEYVARNPKVFDGASERERVRRDDADVARHVD